MYFGRSKKVVTVTEVGARILGMIRAKRDDGVTVSNFQNWATVIASQGIIESF